LSQGRIVGIDLGTTNSLVAVVDSGIPLVLAGADGQRLTSSVVHFPGGGASPFAGAQAARLRAAMPSETVYSIKRFMGRRGHELAQETMLVTYALEGDGGNPVKIQIHDRLLAPEEISSEILKKLKGDAEASLGEQVTRAVITVPAYFNDAQRNATKRAGELAGFKVERIVNEPTAAALAYGLDKLREHSKIAVYDLGGGTFDISILELKEGVFEVLATNGNTRLGGDDLDKCIVSFLLDRIRAAGGPDATLDLALLSRIRQAAEEAKVKLSTNLRTEIQLPFLTSAFSFSVELTRSELENLTRNIILQTRPPCIRALADARLEPKDLDHVILVGGQTRMPLVRQTVAEIFGCADFQAAAGNVRVGSEYHRAEGPALNTSQNPEEAVALGAAIQAEILAGGFKNVLLLDVTPLSLGIETFGGLMNVIIPRNSTIPVKAGEMFTTAVDNQANMLIHVLQGEREKAQDNWSLGRFTIDFERAPKGMARVGVQFEIDADGILRVLARDVKAGREMVVEVKSVVDVNDADVRQMVEESVEHAFEDLRDRQWIEARIRAEETVQAAKKGLESCAGEIDPDYQSRIESAIQAVASALATGQLDKLKGALVDLDAVTKPLADLLMEKAVESMLRKRGLVAGEGA
jgi:molecular chaperone DnaK